MNGEVILNAMNFIDEEILYNAEQARNGKKEKIDKKAYRILMAAACFIFAAVSALFINALIAANLPKLELTVNNGDGMGFEGPFLKNPDDFESGNPWKYSVLTSRLPVYESKSHDEKGTPCGLSEKELDSAVADVASALNANIISISKLYANDLHGGYENDFVYCITADTDIASITANAAGGLTVDFNYPVSYPYEFDAAKATEYFTAKYNSLIASIISFEKPEICISTEYNVYGEIHRTFRVYDKSGNKKEDIINYNLNFAEFRIENDGTLTSIYISASLRLCNEIAQYPIISEKKAKEKLISGNYISSVLQYNFPGEEYIAKIDLVYKSNKGETVAPYYRFLVELPEAPVVCGSKNYGIYYVPAVKDKYISSITLIDSEFQ